MSNAGYFGWQNDYFDPEPVENDPAADQAAQWQDAIYKVVCKLSGSDAIDGAGCEGDELAVTLAEIEQAFAIVTDGCDEKVAAANKRADAAEHRALLAERALESLTPGGSEFHGDPIYCAEWIQRRMTNVMQQVKARKAAEARVQELETQLAEAQATAERERARREYDSVDAYNARISDALRRMAEDEQRFRE